MPYTETEIKLYVPNLATVEARLKEAGAKQVKPRLYERNVRYENADHTLTGRGIVVRLRQDDAIRLTYKEPPATSGDDAEISDRFEAEVTVSDFEAMQVILGRLGYYPHMVYEKYRTTYELDHTEVVLDEMPYGNFVEIEGPPDAIRAVRQKIGLSEARAFPQNYAQLFENVQQKLSLGFHDLTFANFAGIDVPESAFD